MWRFAFNTISQKEHTMINQVDFEGYLTRAWECRDRSRICRTSKSASSPTRPPAACQTLPVFHHHRHRSRQVLELVAQGLNNGSQ